MEILEHKYATLKKALETLDAAIMSLKKQDQEKDETTYIVYRDSLIKRFEYCSDMFWKFLKEYLEQKYGILASAPKSVYRECLVAQILSEDETEKCIKMVEARNQTSHIYKEEFAEYIAKRIPQLYTLMIEIMKRIKETK